MKKMKTALSLLVAICLAAALCACGGGTAPSSASEAASPAQSAESAGDGAAAAPVDYPKGNLNGIVPWGAGGGTDSLMRPLASLAEQQLSTSIVIQNMAGAGGTIGTQYVYDAEADGNYLLMAAENGAIYDSLEISDLTYDNFDCVFLIGDETVGIIVGKNSKYTSFTEIVEDALAAPGTIRLATAGIGSMPWQGSAFITAVTGAQFNQIPYDSDASTKTAVMSGECDFGLCKVQSGIEEYKAGEINYLCMLSTETVSVMPEIPLVIAEYPDFEQYLPWGPFYGIWVKEGTDPAITKILSDAFTTAASDPEYQSVLENFNVNFIGTSGEEAQEYIRSWGENTTNALRSSGALEKAAE